MSSRPPAEIDKTAARRFPLVHKLVHFADLRNFYRDMREALISANRRAGAQQGLVTKARKKIAKLEAELSQIEQERAQGGPTRQSTEDLHRAVERLLERADAVEFFEETVEDIEADSDRAQPTDES